MKIDKIKEERDIKIGGLLTISAREAIYAAILSNCMRIVTSPMHGCMGLDQISIHPFMD